MFEEVAKPDRTEADFEEAAVNLFEDAFPPYYAFAMGHLILVKHAAPEIAGGLPSSRWSLSESGRQQCHELARKLAPYSPAVLFASREPKAVQTAEAIASHLDLSPTFPPGLHENDRTAFPFFPSEADYHARMRDFFARCEHRVVGRESANEAHARFVDAVQRLLPDNGARPTVIVTHGTVATLLVARANGLGPYAFWREFDFASFVVVSTPAFVLKDLVHVGNS